LSVILATQFIIATLYIKKNSVNNNTVSIDKVALQQYYLKIQHQKQRKKERQQQ
jgi:general stress protein CsbA